MKTVKDWLKTLEEPYRSEALENTKVEHLNKQDCLLSEALLGAFVWTNTIQGLEYWNDLYDNIVENEN